jgi:uncharacterized protein (TIGR02444 family)
MSPLSDQEYLGDLWSFALDLYNKPHVSDACLLLQDEGNVDVPILLFAVWLMGASIPLSKIEIGEIDRSLKDWRLEVIVPLRTIRRRLKIGPQPAPSPQTEVLRSIIKNAEFASEKIELSFLEKVGRIMNKAIKKSESDPGANIEAVLDYFCPGCGYIALIDALNTIRQAAS